MGGMPLRQIQKENLVAVGCVALWMTLTAFFVGFRPEHLFMGLLILLLFFASTASRKLIVGLVPLILFAVSYDWMRVFPNYKVNPIDIEGLYNAEKLWFGIKEAGEVLIPSEYFAIHTSTVMDFFAGIFYLTWVPLPVAFALYLYFKRERSLFLRFSMVFLLVNLVGFVGYYIHPAAAPWYVMNYGFEPIMNTPGSSAGLERFDELTGIPIFNILYGRNSNVFAAVPSLHAAYLVVVLYYAILKKCSAGALIAIATCMCGIWFTAVYSAHHYIIDVLLGIVCALFGIALFEGVLLKTRTFNAFFNGYCRYIY